MYLQDNTIPYQSQFASLLERTPQLSNLKPNEWAEKKVMIPGKGRLNYDFNPYCREIIDTLAPDHPARRVAVMKGSQITFSSGVIMPGLGYIIEEQPANTLLMVGTTELIKPAIEKLDLMIQGAKLQDYLRYGVEKRAKRKTGDTDEIKHFSNGYIKIGSNSNPKSIAQIDLMYIFLDDFDAMKGGDKATGSLTDLIEMRAASNKNSYKMMMISTPLLMNDSNIYRAYMRGDRRNYMVECPCCHEPIVFRWTVNEGEVLNGLTNVVAKGSGGIVYERDNHGRVKESSVGYVCYLCAGYFTDSNKQRQLREGYWQPTAIANSPVDFSYHISSLYAPVGMFGWPYYAVKHAEANPVNGPIDDAKMQVINNTCLGWPHMQAEADTDARGIMRNTRSYNPFNIPEKLSIADGNGRIVLLTLSADLNGTMKGVNGAKVDDARLDYEIEGWAETGQRYSIAHGSIGTFVPLEGKMDNPAPRQRWTYEHGKQWSVWPELERIINDYYPVDTGRKMQILLAGVDCGHHSQYAYEFMDKMPGVVVGLRGDKEHTPQADDRNTPIFKIGRERNDYYLLDVNKIKDRLHRSMQSTWDADMGEVQPAGFMNFPTPSNGLYLLENYFEHFQSEHRVLVPNRTGTGTMAVWQKKRSTVQNHMWDCKVYNSALKDIVVHRVGKDFKIKDFTWREFADMIASQLKNEGH